MLRFSLATFLAVPLVGASFHVAAVYPFALSVFCIAAVVSSLLYALTFKQKSSVLDVKTHPVFVYVFCCLLACSAVLLGLQVTRRISSKVNWWVYSYAMKSRGYEEVIRTVRDSNGYVSHRIHEWRPKVMQEP